MGTLVYGHTGFLSTQTQMWTVDAHIRDAVFIEIIEIHKAFQNQDQDQAQVKNSITMDFFKNPQ